MKTNITTYYYTNVIYLYDDRMDIFLNFRDGAVSIEFDAKMWKAGKKRNPGDTKSSDLTSSGSPTKETGAKRCLFLLLRARARNRRSGKPSFTPSGRRP